MRAPFLPDTTRANCDTGHQDLMAALGDGDDGGASKRKRADHAADAGSDPFEGFEFNTQPESPM